jgi:hypothetical protein
VQHQQLEKKNGIPGSRAAFFGMECCLVFAGYIGFSRGAEHFLSPIIAVSWPVGREGYGVVEDVC